MSLDKLLLIAYVCSPFLAVLLPGHGRGGRFLTPGSAATLFRVLVLSYLGFEVATKGGGLALSATLVSGYPLRLALSLDAYRLGFLLTAELCFLLAHWMSPGGRPAGGLVRMLIGLCQGLCTLFVMSDNAVATGGLQILTGAAFFFLIRFSLGGKRDDLAASISGRMYLLHFILGLLTIGWGMTQSGSSGLLFAHSPGSDLGLVIWILLLILAVPVPLWSRWFRQAVETLPEGVTLALVTFVSALTLKFATLFNVVHQELEWWHRLVIFSLGVIGGAFSLAALFSARTRRVMLGSLPGFFFSLVLVSVGVSRSELVISAYFTCLFVPVLTALVLYASSIGALGGLQKSFVAILLPTAFGLPGTPVFLIFSAIGAKSLGLGTGYMLLFGLIWFLYFSANVYICRRIFMDSDPPVPGTVSGMDWAPRLFAAYGLFLIGFIFLATQVAWRIL
jgi:hypothetical protein